MDERTNTKTITVAIENGAASAEGRVSVLRVGVPEEIDAATFLSQLGTMRARRRNAYDTSPEAALEAMRRKYGYAIEAVPIDVLVDASRSDWYACTAQAG